MLSSSIAAPSISFAHEQGKRPTQDDSALIAHVTKMGAIEYARVFKQFIESCKTGEFLSHERSGTTFCGAIFDPRTGDVVVANLGDSRAMIIARQKSTGLCLVISLTQDHKPDLPRIEKEIIKKGGVVSEVEGVYRVNRVLAIGSAIGDIFIADKLKADPDIMIFNLREILNHSSLKSVPELSDPSLFEISHLFLCCDGVFEVMKADADIDYGVIEDGISLSGKYKFIKTTDDKRESIGTFIHDKIASGEFEISQMIANRALDLRSKDNISALSLAIGDVALPTMLVVCDGHGNHEKHRTSQKVIENLMRYMVGDKSFVTEKLFSTIGMAMAHGAPAGAGGGVGVGAGEDSPDSPAATTRVRQRPSRLPSHRSLGDADGDHEDSDHEDDEQEDGVLPILTRQPTHHGLLRPAGRG